MDNPVSTIISIYDQVINTYEHNKETIEIAENETSDLLHEIELGKPRNAFEGYLLYKEIKEVRERRRRAKNENELLRDFYHYVKSQDKRPLSQIQNRVAKIREKQKLRRYVPRFRTDLTIGTPDVNRPFEVLKGCIK